MNPYRAIVDQRRAAIVEAYKELNAIEVEAGIEPTPIPDMVVRSVLPVKAKAWEMTWMIHHTGLFLPNENLAQLFKGEAIQ